MNHLYRVIFNKQTGVFCAVSELARSNGKANGVCGTLAKAVRLVLAPLAMAMALVGVAHAAPTDGQVVAGQANIAQIGAVTNINQASQNAVINWQDFSIKAHETVNFHQPSSEAVTLNRVIGNQRSVIDGAMNANGKVFIQNEHGTLIGKNAQINVGSLVATTAKISDDDFMKGNYRFDNAQGSIENLGHISVPQGGVVALIAPIVKNSGTIVAPQGKVLLASADSFSITLPDNVNFSYTLDKGTLQGLVDNKGAIIADGGRIVLTALGVDTVKKSLIKHTGLVQANTVRNVNGVIELVGDLDNSALDVSGSLKAEGKGDDKGGLIETSASTVKVDDNAQVSTQADNGKTGTWLIDPKDFVVAPTGGDITGAKVAQGLQSNNVTLKSRDGAKEGNGDVIINDEISWDKNTLTLNAENDIHINKTLHGTGTAKLALEYGQRSENGKYKAMVDGKETTKDNDYHLQKDTPLAQRTVKINLPEGKNFSTKQGSNGDTHEFMVIHQMPNIGKNGKGDWESKFTERNIALGADIDVSHTKNHDGFAGWQLPKDGNYDEWGRVAGLGHTVSNLTLHSKKDYQYTGLFQENSSSGYIRDIGVVNANVKSEGETADAGSLVGRGSDIHNSYATGEVSTIGNYASAGGLAGFVDNVLYSHAKMMSVSTRGDDSYTGGLAGQATKIKYSYATGDISSTGTRSHSGGLAGQVNDPGSMVYDSYATGNVSTSGRAAAAGGLLGAGKNVSNSYSTGNSITTNASAHTGGLVGRVGIGGSVSNSYATGNSTTQGKNAHAGGLVGWGHNITDSYSVGVVSAQDPSSKAGGLVGYYDDDKGSANSFFSDDKNAGLQAIGKGNHTITNVTGKTEAELKQQSTFTDWDFDKVWYINAGEMPKLHAHKKGTVVITPKTDLAINANHLSKVYDGKAVEDEAQLKQIAKDNGFEDVVAISGLKNGDDLSSLGTLSYDGTWKNAKDANTYTIVPKGLAGGQDYEIKYGEGSLTINKRPVSIIGTKVYDGTDVVLDSNLRLNNIVAGDDVSLKAGTQGKIADKNVGIHKINDPDTLVIIGTNANNYVASFQNVQVTPKALNIAVSKDFDDSPTFNVGFTATNLIGSDKADVVGTATVADKKVGTYQDFVSASLTSNNRNYVYTQGTSAVNAVIKAVSQPVPPTTTNPTPQPVTPSPVPIVPQPTTPTPIVPQPVQPQPTIPTPTVPQPSTPATPVTTPQPVVPVQPSPVPVVPQPVQSTPVQTQPVQTVPVQTQPVVSIPIVPTPSSKSELPTTPLTSGQKVNGGVNNPPNTNTDEKRKTKVDTEQIISSLINGSEDTNQIKREEINNPIVAHMLNNNDIKVTDDAIKKIIEDMVSYLSTYGIYAGEKDIKKMIAEARGKSLNEALEHAKDYISYCQSAKDATCQSSSNILKSYISSSLKQITTNILNKYVINMVKNSAKDLLFDDEYYKNILDKGFDYTIQVIVEETVGVLVDSLVDSIDVNLNNKNIIGINKIDGILAQKSTGLVRNILTKSISKVSNDLSKLIVNQTLTKFGVSDIKGWENIANPIIKEYIDSAVESAMSNTPAKFKMLDFKVRLLSKLTMLTLENTYKSALLANQIASHNNHILEGTFDDLIKTSQMYSDLNFYQNIDSERAERIQNSLTYLYQNNGAISANYSYFNVPDENNGKKIHQLISQALSAYSQGDMEKALKYKNEAKKFAQESDREYFKNKGYLESVEYNLSTGKDYVVNFGTALTDYVTDSPQRQQFGKTGVGYYTDYYATLIYVFDYLESKHQH